MPVAVAGTMAVAVAAAVAVAVALTTMITVTVTAMVTVTVRAGMEQHSWPYWIALPAPRARLQALQVQYTLSDRWSNNWQTLPPWVMKKSGKSCRK